MAANDGDRWWFDFGSGHLYGNILNINNALLATIQQQRKQLRSGFILGTDGRILEWDREYAEVNPGHRHMSHLYGFHPGDEVTFSKSPELFDAVRKTLDYRLEVSAG